MTRRKIDEERRPDAEPGAEQTRAGAPDPTAKVPAVAERAPGDTPTAAGGIGGRSTEDVDAIEAGSFLAERMPMKAEEEEDLHTSVTREEIEAIRAGVEQAQHSAQKALEEVAACREEIRDARAGLHADFQEIKGRSLSARAAGIQPRRRRRVRRPPRRRLPRAPATVGAGGAASGATRAPRSSTGGDRRNPVNRSHPTISPTWGQSRSPSRARRWRPSRNRAGTGVSSPCCVAPGHREISPLPNRPFFCTRCPTTPAARRAASRRMTRAESSRRCRLEST